MVKSKGGFYISRIKQVQDRVFCKMLENAGIDISSGQGRILYVLWQESPLSIGEIGKRASLAKTTMTAMLKRLESKGIVLRTFDKLNKRQINVSLTIEAEHMKERYQKVSDDMTQVFYKGFSNLEIIEFEKKLGKILNNLIVKEAEGN